MICPSCFADMSEETHNRVRLDRCTRCSGVWFDGGELEAFHAGDGSSSLEGVPGPAAQFEPTGDSAHIRCPRCEHDILRMGMIASYSVMRCTTCGGLFLPLANSQLLEREKNVVESAVEVLDEIVDAIFYRNR